MPADAGSPGLERADEAAASTRAAPSRASTAADEGSVDMRGVLIRLGATNFYAGEDCSRAFRQVAGLLRSLYGFKADVDAELVAMRYQQDLVRLRETAGVSQRDLASRLGVTQPVVARLESGKARNVEVRTLVRAAAALGGRVVLKIERDRRRSAARAPRERTGRRKTARTRSVRDTSERRARKSSQSLSDPINRAVEWSARDRGVAR